MKSRLSLRERLNVGTVPTVKMHPVGTVPTAKMHPVGTFPAIKCTLEGPDGSFIQLVVVMGYFVFRLYFNMKNFLLVNQALVFRIL